MADEDFNDLEDDLEISRNSLTVLVTGILVIIAGFVVYNYFSDQAAPATPEEDQQVLEEVESGETTTQEGEEGQLSRPGEEDGAVAGSDTVVNGDQGEMGTGGPEPGVEQVSTWAPNDIQPNTIEPGEYTVQEGDTLWEIAEGVYGSGFEWTKIRDANPDTVGTLPNGSQALISTGQVLNLPN